MYLRTPFSVTISEWSPSWSALSNKTFAQTVCFNLNMRKCNVHHLIVPGGGDTTHYFSLFNFDDMRKPSPLIETRIMSEGLFQT